jgi:hypothetical protein
MFRHLVEFDPRRIQSRTFQLGENSSKNMSTSFHKKSEPSVPQQVNHHDVKKDDVSITSNK